MSNQVIAVLVPIYSPSKNDLETFLDDYCVAYTGFERLVFAIEAQDDFNEIKNIISLKLFKKDIKYQILDFYENLGLSYALHNAIEKILENYICRHDIGDRLLPNKFHVVHQAIKTHDFDILYTNALISHGSENITRHCPSTLNRLKFYFALSSPIIHPTVTFKKSALIEVGNYNVKLKYCEDLDLWLKLIKHKKRFFHIPDITIVYQAPKKVRPIEHWRTNLSVRIANFRSLPIFYSITGIFVTGIFTFLPEFLRNIIYKRLK